MYYGKINFMLDDIQEVIFFNVYISKYDENLINL